MQIKFSPLTLPLPSLLVPFYQGEGGVAGPPAVSKISKTVVPMNMRFCMVLETSLNVLEMLKFLK